MAKFLRVLFILSLLIQTIHTHGREKADSTRPKLKASATFSLNSNGIASIPAFSLGDPAVMAALSLAKGRFSYDPVLAYGLDLRPWFIDNWLNYRIINRPVFELRAGFNVSSFFTDYETPEETILQGNRYFAYALTGTYRFTPNASLQLAYWNDRGQDPGTIKGHYVNLQGDISEIPIGKHILFAAGLQLFGISYDGNNDGLFISPKLAASVRNVPFSLFFQATQPLVTNVEPYPGFQWNIGLGYTL